MVKINLPYLIEKNKITQKIVSEATGIPKNTINRYYNGTWTTINKEHIELLCTFFNCDISDLMSFSTNENTDPYKIDLFKGAGGLTNGISRYIDSNIEDTVDETIKNYVHHILMRKIDEINKEIEHDVHEKLDD